MENNPRNLDIARETFASQMKSTLTLQQHLESMKITKEDKMMRSDFVPAKSLSQHAHMLPMNRRLSMYNMNRPLSPPRYYIVSGRKKARANKVKKCHKARINLSQKLSVNEQYSPMGSPIQSPGRDSPHSPTSLKRWVFEDNIETLVQKYGDRQCEEETLAD